MSKSIENKKINLIKSFLELNNIEITDDLKETPERFVKAFDFLISGYKQKPSEILGKTFKSDYNGMVIVKDIPFYSLCEHHLLPIKGVCSVGYIPHGVIVGLSKIPRLVECYARRLTTQENMTDNIAYGLYNYIENNYGVAVYIEAYHSCMSSRGVQKDAPMITTSLIGSFENHEVRDEFFKSIGRK